MNSARLSPAASLLRNSKLFALPSAVPQPPSKPSSAGFSQSDTSTTTFPTRAAIYTSSASLARGDWGLKRGLPQKAFTKTKTPVIRISDEIDTREHVADFESAGDHVLTLQKWETTPMMIGNKPMAVTGRYHSVFAPNVDNTTVDSSAFRLQRRNRSAERLRKYEAWGDAQRDPETGDVVAPRGQSKTESLDVLLQRYTADKQAEEKAAGRELLPPQTIAPVKIQPKRWRYKGPWLAGLSNLSFEDFMKKVDLHTMVAFREHLKKGIIETRQRDYQRLVDAAQANQTLPPAPPLGDVTKEEVNARLQFLRHKPNDFGPEIATFFDLPRGPNEGQTNDFSREYMYPAEETEASESYHNYGVPCTHPSAGFSYLRSTRYANMDPMRGPMRPNRPLAARVLRDNPNNKQERHSVGVGGMVARFESGDARRNLDWQPSRGGKRLAVSFKDAYVLTDGSMEIGVTTLSDATSRLDEKNVPQMTDEAPRTEPRSMIGTSRRLPSLFSRIPDGQSPGYRRAAPPPSEPDKEINSLLENRYRQGL